MDFLFNQKAKPAPSGAQAGAGLIKEGSTATFVADVIEVSQQVPVIVDFWAPWCGPCKQLGPALEKLVTAARGAVRMVKINVDQNQQLAAQLRVQSIPAVYAFKDGRPVDGFVGTLPDSQLKAFVERLTAGAPAEMDLTEVLNQAKAILADGEVEAALQIYQEVLAVEADNPQALGGLLRCYLQSGQADAAKEILADLPPELARHTEIAAVRTALDLAEQASQTAGATADLRRRLATDPQDHQARFDLAMAYYAAGEREAAVDELLDIVRRDREWNEDGARKQLVKLFEAFGHTDPLTVAARRKLSTLLFS